MRQSAFFAALLLGLLPAACDSGSKGGADGAVDGDGGGGHGGERVQVRPRERDERPCRLRDVSVLLFFGIE